MLRAGGREPSLHRHREEARAIMDDLQKMLDFVKRSISSRARDPRAREGLLPGEGGDEEVISSVTV